MTPAEESAAIARLVAADPRFGEDAYRLVMDGLDVARSQVGRDVSGGACISGVVAAAISQFGMAAPVVVEAIGVRDSADVSEIIANLVAAQRLKWSPDESRETFVFQMLTRDFMGEVRKQAGHFVEMWPPRIVAGARSR